ESLAGELAAKTDNMSTWQTTTGFLIGTVQYMSPEQASGGQMDYRSDQFSFGLVLYEMITGTCAFPRRTVAETLVAILREQAQAVGTQNTDVPAPLGWAIERCLE